MLGVAPTGSGKTAAYAVPLLALLDKPASEGVRALVLAPTKGTRPLRRVRVCVRVCAR
jgi:superfamily II DNA/RNA helicase